MVSDSLIVNQLLDPLIQKFVKLFLPNCLFTNMITLNNQLGDIVLSFCLEVNK